MSAPPFLPTSVQAPLNCDGRPIRQPPIFDYSDLIDEAYEKKLEATLKYTKGNVVKATEIMDLDTERRVVVRYFKWAGDSNMAVSVMRSRAFLRALEWDLGHKRDVLGSEWRGLDVELVREGDGNYVLEDSKAWVRRHNLEYSQDSKRPHRLEEPDLIWTDGTTYPAEPGHGNQHSLAANEGVRQPLLVVTPFTAPLPRRGSCFSCLPWFG